MLSFKWKHFKQSIILMAVRWYLAYARSYRDIEEVVAERGVRVDHSTVNRWVIEYAPQLENVFRKKHKSQIVGTIIFNDRDFDANTGTTNKIPEQYH